MYNCQICQTPSQPGQPLRRHVRYRAWTDPLGRKRKDVEQEIPVCEGCHAALAGGGTTLTKVINARGRVRQSKGLTAPAKPLPLDLKLNQPVKLGRRNNAE